MDEADRMIDMGFEEDVRTIFSFFQVCILYILLLIIHYNLIRFHNYCQFDSRAKDKHYCFLPLCQKKFKTLLDQL